MAGLMGAAWTTAAVAVLRLVAEGKVELDAPIEKCLPGIVRGEGIDAGEITVRHLLQHTAALRHPAKFAPGTKGEYSNTGYLLAGMVIEKVTGRPIQERITERVIRKAGLKRSTPGDLGEFFRVLLEGRLLPAAQLAEMRKTAAPSGSR